MRVEEFRDFGEATSGIVSARRFRGSWRVERQSIQDWKSQALRPTAVVLCQSVQALRRLLDDPC